MSKAEIYVWLQRVLDEAPAIHAPLGLLEAYVVSRELMDDLERILEDDDQA